MVLTVSAGLILAVYVFLIVRYTFGFLNLSGVDSVDASALSMTFSVVIPFRNEADRIGYLISDLLNQQGTIRNWEIICVDDHSVDGTADRIREYGTGDISLKVIPLPEGKRGKKAALMAGINAARGEWIIQTDADCRVGPGFISGHGSMILGEQPTLVAGPVRLGPLRSSWDSIEALEFLSLSVTGAGSFYRSVPLMCNGANMVYRRDFYLGEIGKMNQPTPSGDDMFLLSRALEKDKKVVYNKSSRVIVDAAPAGSPASFFSQRIRWASKTRYYSQTTLSFVAGWTWLTSAAGLILMMMGLFNSRALIAFVIYFFLKSAVDFNALKAGAAFFDQHRVLRWFFPVSLTYYIYVPLTGILSLFSGYRWKGRLYRQTNG